MNRGFKGYVIAGADDMHLVDPDYTLLPMLEPLGFTIRSEPPSRDYIPRLTMLQRITVPDLTWTDLERLTDDELWRLHDSLVKQSTGQAGHGNLKLLDLKVELAYRAFVSCRLCGWCCDINRFHRAGRCGLQHDAYYERAYVHVAEEGPITPCAVIKLFACGLKCRGCQAHEVLRISREAKPLGPDIWDELRSAPGFQRASAVQWVGGGPDVSLPNILEALTFAPDLPPQVWNCDGFGMPVVYRLLQGVADVFLPDFKFGPGPCCEQVAGITNYWPVATTGLQEMMKQDARLIVRHLVMPGHLTCCTEPVMRWLSQYRDRLWISFLRFVPFSRAIGDPALGRCTTENEMETAHQLARDCGLRDIKESQGRFWLEA